MINVILLGITSLLTDLSSEMIVPILPFLIQSLGGGGLAIGLAFGVGDAVAALMKVFSGYWADRTKRFKTFVFVGYFFSAFAKFFYPFISSWQSIAVLRPIERLGKGFRDAPRDAIVSESVPPEMRGKAFGVQRAMDSVGALIGSVAVLVLFLIFGLSLQTLFFFAALIGLVAVFPIFFVRVPSNLTLSRKRIGFRELPLKARHFIAIATVFAIANFSNAFFILRAQSLFVDLSFQDSLSLALVLYIFFGIFDAVFSEPAGALSDQLGRRRIILTGYLLFSVVSLGFMVVPYIAHTTVTQFLIMLIFFALYGVFRAFIDASQRAMVADLSDPGQRATALGTFEAATGLAAIPAGLIAGFLWDFSPTLTFAHGFGFSILASALLLVFIRGQK
ncbi:MAG: MFS transporter [Patescibacteria group bacterium]